MPDQAPIACSEVWGGNRSAQAALVLPGITGHVTSKPYQQADSGGDVHYVSSCGSGRITRVLLADVSGHGSDVSHIAVRLRDAMRRYLNHIEPGPLASRINSELSQATVNEGHFATALAMTYFGPSGRFTICNAGHPLPLLKRANKQHWTTIDQPDTKEDIANLPLGILEESGYTCREFTLNPGDTLFTYTDCLNEAKNDQNNQLGTEGLLDILNQLQDTNNTPPAELADAILTAIQQRGYSFDDDLTTLILRCTERTAGAPFFKRLAGSIRTLINGIKWRNMPWPEFSKTNLVGLFFPKTGTSKSK